MRDLRPRRADSGQQMFFPAGHLITMFGIGVESTAEAVRRAVGLIESEADDAAV